MRRRLDVHAAPQRQEVVEIEKEIVDKKYGEVTPYCARVSGIVYANRRFVHHVLLAG